jgi:hypothetical protein
MLKSLEELNCYSWSGHSAVMGKKKHEWMDASYVLSQFGSRKRAARSAYRSFVMEGMNQGRVPELTGGGLIRSKGGWSQVESARRRGQKEEYDERILGSGEFVTAIFKEAEERQIRQPVGRVKRSATRHNNNERQTS